MTLTLAHIFLPGKVSILGIHIFHFEVFGWWVDFSKTFVTFCCGKMLKCNILLLCTKLTKNVDTVLDNGAPFIAECLSLFLLYEILMQCFHPLCY